MKSDFMLALTQLSAEKNLSKEVVINAIESALVSAYRKNNFAPTQEISVKINPADGSVEVWAQKIVAEKPKDPLSEISLKEARRIQKDVKIGDAVMVESTPSNAGRIAAQTAKQVILQRLHEAEHSAIFEEYANKEGDIITGTVQRIEPGQVLVDVGRTEALLPAAEQMRTERYRVGQRLKVLLLQASHSAKGARVIVSRSHPDLLRRLFELEVPEVFNGTVEIKAIAREAGYRSKVAVTARQPGIDPVGCCVGLRGIRIQNIVNELNGEKIDVVQWNPDQAVFIANALSPTHIAGVMLNLDDQIATAVVPDKQLSLAIGKEGQNARLAAKLTGWRIDIRSSSSVEAEKLAAAKAAAEAAPATVTGLETIEAVTGEAAAAVEPVMEPVTVPPAEAPAEKGVAPVAGTAAELEPVVLFAPQTVAREKPQLRFSEDILGTRTEKPVGKAKKKKGVHAKDGAEDGIKVKKARRTARIVTEEEEDYS